jgi:hypothetical protein
MNQTQLELVSSALLAVAKEVLPIVDGEECGRREP